MYRPFFLLLVVCGTLMAPTAGATETTPQGQDQPSTQTPSAEESKPEPMKLEGSFQAVRADEIRIELQEWTNLETVEAARHGAQVQVGDVLIRLASDKLERAIEEASQEIETDELAVQEAQVKLELARRSQDLAVKAAVAADRIATEELKDFVTTGR